MAVFGFQIMLTLIAASILQKLSARYSIGRWLLSWKLYHYLHPSNEDLKGLAQKNFTQNKKKTRNFDKKNNEPEVFSIPKQTEITLTLVSVNPLEVLQLPYYVEYRWLIDFTCYTSVIFVISELFIFCFPTYSSKEMNLSVVWMMLLLGIALKSLASITALYFRGSADTGERSLVISFGAICFLLTMVLFLVSDNLFDIGLLEAHHNFTESTAKFLQSQELPVPKERSPVLLYLVMSLMFGFLSSFLTFPCLRYARMYNDSLRFAADDPLRKLLLHASFFSPLISLLLWVKPLARDRLVESENPVLTEAQFESLRLWAALVPVVLRIFTLYSHLQAYLNIAYDKVKEMNKEGGRITNVELQRMIAQTFFYLCVAAIQYFAPIIAIFSLTCILKVLGQYSWLAVFNLNSVSNFTNGSTAEAIASSTMTPSKLMISLTHVYSIFNVVVNRGVWSFFLFSTSFISFLGSVVGAVYSTKFKDE